MILHLPSMGKSTERSDVGWGSHIPTRNASHFDLPMLGR